MFLCEINATASSSNKQALHYGCLCFVFFFAELPYGWEKIDDPIYGSYYVE